MRDLGLSPEVLSKINHVLRHHPMVTSATVFGSRAMGDFSPYSDVDIAIYGCRETTEIEAIICDLDNLPTVYTYDLVAYDRIKNPALKNHIDRVGVVIYSQRKWA